MKPIQCTLHHVTAAIMAACQAAHVLAACFAVPPLSTQKEQGGRAVLQPHDDTAACRCWQPGHAHLVCVRGAPPQNARQQWKAFHCLFACVHARRVAQRSGSPHYTAHCREKKTPMLPG